ncbi:MAG TPA: rhomboid family intramembrane serine protease [Candidatus Polarisedimenticolia bacterium]|jgi:membrane associated rhomboid family serine protease|nr:rhomboid family intramembrane serine protease [Candidatus Polarisedimenticolia bacterium]
MNRPYRYERAGNSMGIGGTMTPAVRALIIVNTAIFVFEGLMRLANFGGLDEIFRSFFALQPSLVYGRGYLWQLVTYLFLHGDLSHILINMFMLWMFGVEMERMWGAPRFLRYYFLTGVGAGVVTCFFSPESRTIGASGAIFGVMLAYGMTFPDRQILFWFFFPMKAKHFVLLLAGIELWVSSSFVSDGIGHFAHLGGMLFGYLYLKRAWRLKDWISELRWKARRRRFKVFESREDKDRYPYH